MLQVTFRREGILKWVAWWRDAESGRWMRLPASEASRMVIASEAEDVGFIEGLYETNLMKQRQ